MKMNSNISKKLLDILKDGTPKQKALFVCKYYLEPSSMKMYGEEPAISREDVKTIKKSLRTYVAQKSYNKWTSVFSTYVDIVSFFGLAVAEYQRRANELASFLTLWDAYEREEDLINSCILAVKKTGSKEATDAIIKTLKQRYRAMLLAPLKQRADGYFFFDVFSQTGLYKELEKFVRATKDSFAGIKAVIIATDQFTKETKSEAFVPTFLKSSMQAVKEDKKSYFFNETFKRKYLRLMKEWGKSITEEDEKRAVFPEYAEIEIDAKMVEFCANRIDIIKYNNGLE